MGSYRNLSIGIDGAELPREAGNVRRHSGSHIAYLDFGVCMFRSILFNCYRRSVKQP